MEDRYKILVQVFNPEGSEVFDLTTVAVKSNIYDPDSLSPTNKSVIDYLATLIGQAR